MPRFYYLLLLLKEGRDSVERKQKSMNSFIRGILDLLLSSCILSTFLILLYSFIFLDPLTNFQLAWMIAFLQLSHHLPSRIPKISRWWDLQKELQYIKAKKVIQFIVIVSLAPVSLHNAQCNIVPICQSESRWSFCAACATLTSWCYIARGRWSRQVGWGLALPAAA